MAKIIGLDYGKRRVGIAATDDLQIIASGVGAVFTKDIFKWLKDYVEANDVSEIVCGLPKDLSNNQTDATEDVSKFLEKLRRAYPKIRVSAVDERFTSKMAKRSIFESGVKKKARRDKGLVDEVSAVLILQSYMAQNAS